MMEKMILITLSMITLYVSTQPGISNYPNDSDINMINVYSIV